MEMQEKFKASEGIGTFVAVIGWIVMGVSVIVALVLFSGQSELRVVTGMLSLVGGIVLGGMTVVQGQMIQCLVAIERNTRRPLDVPATSEVSSTSEQTSQDAYQKGLALAELNRHDEAIKAFNEAIVGRPNDADIWFSRGLSLGMLGQLDEAIKAYDHVLVIRSYDAEAYFNRGGIHARKGNKSLALMDLSKAIALDRSNRNSATEDEDFSSLRDDPDFKKIVGE